MKLLEAWVETPMAGAVGWTLLHSLWEGAIVAAALAALLMVLRSPRARYVAACLALLVMLGGFGITLVRVMPESASGPRIVRSPAFPVWNVQPDLDAGIPSNGGLAAAVPWLAPVWIAGVWAFCLWHAAGWVSVSRMRRRGVCCAPVFWQSALARLREGLSLTRPVLLLESCLADAPMVLGHFRPVILMPVGLLTGLPPGQVEAILLHELAHIRRYDYLVNVLQRSVESLFFYHPAAWWISRVIRAERENCCDDAAVKVSRNAHEYAAALAALEENRWQGREPAVAATGGNLVKRIRRLLYPRGPNGLWTPLFATLVLVATAAAALAAWQSESAPQTAAAAQQTVWSEKTPYGKWLDEDVVYIIDDAERATFQKLATDAEREKFIEQFWLRRDPTPGTDRNEFKEEHYRRIAYANERFASGIPGWRTDRGHMYIVYGPSDEIESHPKENGTPYARQVWMYRHVEGVGDRVFVTFVDRSDTGDYRLAPGNAR